MRVDGLNLWQNATVKKDIKSEYTGGKTVMTRDSGEFVAEYDVIAFCDNQERKERGLLAHYAVTSKRDRSIFRSSPFTHHVMESGFEATFGDLNPTRRAYTPSIFDKGLIDRSSRLGQPS